MAKGYWIVHIDVTDKEKFQHYASSTGPVLQQYSARFLARAGRYFAAEGVARSRNTIVEFPSYEAAVNCWQSDDYQALRQRRLGGADIELVIVEGIESQ